jgi:hypothetical protein
VRRGLRPAGSDADRTLALTGQNPCGLASLSEVQSIVGARITGHTVAPLGPTCVFKFGTSKAAITLAVETLSFTKITRQMRVGRRLTVAGRVAYCGVLGRQMLFASLGNGRVLNVTAPCAVAERLAAVTVGRIRG